MFTNRTDEAASSWRSSIHGVIRRRPLAVSVICAALAVISPAMSSTVQAAAPRVAIVVGPAGAVTSEYRSLAVDAARAARAAGAQVSEVYSPDATWPAVRAALHGASLVVYLGHGNGWPSRYSDALNRETQDGLGLNAVPGLDDTSHRYFGETYLAREVRLAPNAIVVLARLCYASGNSEPGLPEGTLEVARARADNFAAGFLAAGAGAVVADAFAPPAYYVKAILGRSSAGGTASQSIEATWRRSPTFHGHVRSFSSIRTPGARELLDPTEQTSGFYRSLVGRLSVHAADVVGSAVSGSPAAVPVAHSGPAVDSLALAGRPVAGSKLSLTVRLTAGKDVAAPTALGIGSRWIPLEIEGPAATDSPDAQPRATPSPASSPSSPLPTASPTRGPTWSIDAAGVIAAEEPAGVISVAAATRTGNTFVAPVIAPATAGLYRLAVTLFDASGAAYDAETQQAVPAVIVQVAAPLQATLSAPRALIVEGGGPIALPITVVNAGSIAWVQDPGPAEPGLARWSGHVTLVGRWLALDPANAPGPPLTASIVAPEPGAATAVVLAGLSPALPGRYLLELDLESPLLGSLAWLGALDGSIVRLEVTARNEHRQ